MYIVHIVTFLFLILYFIIVFLEPALEMAGGLETYGTEGEWAFIPVSIGFFFGKTSSLNSVPLLIQLRVVNTGGADGRS